MTMVGTAHAALVAGRRLKILARWMAEVIPPDARTVADVGCGDGVLMRLLAEHRPELAVHGYEVLLRPERQGDIRSFDGQRLPLEDQSVDVVMLVDVLHHTDDPRVLLAEARRVARQAIVLKDHCRNGAWARATLRFMDWVGNAHHGVRLPYNYWSRDEWRSAFHTLGLRVDRWETRLGLYPFPASMAFERQLHFVACLGTS